MFLGGDLYCTRRLARDVYEAQNILIGAGCLLSRGVTMRSTNHHQLYDADSRRRISRGAGIIIGNHVWLGAQCAVLKGTRIGDGCVAGYPGVCTGSREYSPGCVIAGSPARIVSEGILWSHERFSALTPEEMEALEEYREPEHPPERIGLVRLLEIDALDSALNGEDKLTTLKEILKRQKTDSVNL